MFKFSIVLMLIFSVLGSNCIGLYANAASEDAENEVNEIVGNTRASLRLNANNDQVCMGGGWKNDLDGNNNQTGKKNQNPDSNKKYWDYSASTPYKKFLDEQDLIDKYWPKIGTASNKDELYDAVLEPQDDCYYANPQNGYRESVAQSGGKYNKYSADWKRKISDWLPQSTPRAERARPYNTTFTGNYIFEKGWSQNPFTIVTRPILEFEYKKDFYTDAKGNRRRMPSIYDRTDGSYSEPFDKSKTMYQFVPVKNSSISYENVYPTIAGIYNITAQTSVDKEKFKLPGRITKQVNVMDKGYKIKFYKDVDGKKNEMNENIDWNSNSKPSDPDKKTKELFGISLYLEKKKYTIPVPKYDANNYIFEGWQVKEEYITNNYDTKTKVIDLTDSDKDGKYDYIPSAVGENAYFVLQSEIIAKLRSKKTDTITAQTQVVGGDTVQGALNVAPPNIKVTETVTNDKMFTASVTAGYAYDFMGWSYNKDGSHTDLGTENTYKPNPDFNKQSETHKNSTLYATFKPKEYTITFDANGGTDSGSQSTTSTQKASYYNNVKLQKNSFVREGFQFKGWSTSKTSSTVKYADQATAKNIPLNGLDQALNNDIPKNITLYAVWERDIAGVSIEKYKDTLWIENTKWPTSAISNNVYVSSSNTGYNAYELTRYYLDVDMKDLNITPDKLDKSKFYVVWERSTDEGENYQKIDINEYGTFITKAFSGQRSGYSKVVYDAEKGKWFVPLLVKASYGTDASKINGLYRVNVAYDDPQATERVTTEQEFYNGNGKKGWTTSAPTEVKAIRTFETVVNVPANVTLTEKTETAPDGSTKQVIESVHSSNQVTVNKVEHSITKQSDYDWHTPNTAMDGKTTQANSYNDGQHTEYAKQKPFKVSVTWDSTLTDTSQQYTIKNINMYSAANIGTMQKGQQITSGTTSSFSYDGKEENKLLFDFYLKGDKPPHLPRGTLFTGVITFSFTNV